MRINDADVDVIAEAIRAYEDQWIRQCHDRTSVDKRLCVAAVIAVCLRRIIAESGELARACEDAGLRNRNDIIRFAIKAFAASNNIELKT